MNDIQKLRDIANRPKEWKTGIIGTTAKYSPRKLKATWTVELAQDLTAVISEEALKDWAEYFREEIDKEIMKNVAEEAKNNLIIVDDE